ncbi:MAG: 23S rRNA (guanosine-2'-O-)-methyltransferase RlmB [Planctomycetota bacterium]|nr:MAG: 23S rRNA (guanosine-2'-O-)-methyltransferase RlmB [Planctomycetota bacterium]
MDAPETLALRNPHAVLAVIATRPADLVSVRLPAQGANAAWAEVATLAAACGVPVHRAAGAGWGGGGHSGTDSARGGKRGKPDRKSGREGGAEADVLPREGLYPDELFADAASRDHGRGLWLAIDQVQDPHNLGALFRSAAFFGVQGVLLTSNRTAPLSAVAYDTASGGVEHVPFAYVTNLSRELQAVRDAGVWILGSDSEAKVRVDQVDRERPWLLMLGNEEKGLRRLSKEGCDEICRLPALGEIASLNVSVAGAVLMTCLRQGHPGFDA